MNRHGAPALLIFALCLPVLIASGCRTRDYSGTWNGTTAQGKPISFTIKDGKVVKAAISYRLECKSGGFCPLEGSLAGDVDGQSIDGDDFSFKFASATVKGKFTSGTDAAGELKAENKIQPCDCSATTAWTAKKQP